MVEYFGEQVIGVDKRTADFYVDEDSEKISYVLKEPESGSDSTFSRGKEKSSRDLFDSRQHSHDSRSSDRGSSRGNWEQDILRVRQDSGEYEMEGKFPVRNRGLAKAGKKQTQNLPYLGEEFVAGKKVSRAKKASA